MKILFKSSIYYFRNVTYNLLCLHSYSKRSCLFPSSSARQCASPKIGQTTLILRPSYKSVTSNISNTPTYKKHKGHVVLSSVVCKSPPLEVNFCLVTLHQIIQIIQVIYQRNFTYVHEWCRRAVTVWKSVQNVTFYLQNCSFPMQPTKLFANISVYTVTFPLPCRHGATE